MIVQCRGLVTMVGRCSFKCHPSAPWLSFDGFRQPAKSLLPSGCCEFSSKPASDSSSSNSQITNVSESNRSQLSKEVKVTERIKQTTKDVTNISVILAGVGIFGIVIYAVFKEFFSAKSPSAVFASALKKCKSDPRVVELLGEPIKGHGEMTARRRARHVSFVEYENQGRTYMRVKFYLKGTRNTATVQCETDKDSPRSHFRYLFVQTDSYPPQVVIIEDNRALDDPRPLPQTNLI